MVVPSIAAPLAIDAFEANGKSVKSWPLADDEGFELQPGAYAAVQVKVPPLGDKERDAGGSWRGIFSVDPYGSAGTQPGTITLEALDPASGEVFASASTEVSNPAPRADWTVIFSSQHPGAGAALAFDGDPKTDWHSNYSGRKEDPPHWIGLEFGKPTTMTQVRYTPRQGGFTNGVARKYRLEARAPGAAWAVVSAGEAMQTKDREVLELAFPQPTAVEAFRFVIESDWSGGGFGTAGELEPVGITLDPQTPVPASSRASVEIPAEMMALLEEKSFGLRVRNGPDASTVLGKPRFSRIHLAPSPKLFGRPQSRYYPPARDRHARGTSRRTHTRSPAPRAIYHHDSGR